MKSSTLVCPTCKRSDHDAYKSPVSISFVYASSLPRWEEDKCLSFEYAVPEHTAIMSMYVGSPILYESAEIINATTGILICQCWEVISELDLFQQAGISKYDNSRHTSVAKDGIMYAPLEFGYAAYGVRLADKLKIVVKFTQVVKNEDRDKYNVMIKIVTKIKQ